MTKGYVLSEVAMNTVYVSFTAAALLLVFTLLLTSSPLKCCFAENLFEYP
jgi:hypothetical protein